MPISDTTIRYQNQPPKLDAALRCSQILRFHTRICHAYSPLKFVSTCMIPCMPPSSCRTRLIVEKKRSLRTDSRPTHLSRQPNRVLAETSVFLLGTDSDLPPSLVGFCRYTMKVLPAEATCHVSTEEITRAAGPTIEKNFTEEVAEKVRGGWGQLGGRGFCPLRTIRLNKNMEVILFDCRLSGVEH